MMSYISILSMILSDLPKLISSIQALVSSDAAKSAEQVALDFWNHITPGKPNSPALGPNAPAPGIVQDPPST